MTGIERGSFEKHEQIGYIHSHEKGQMYTYKLSNNIEKLPKVVIPWNNIPYGLCAKDTPNYKHYTFLHAKYCTLIVFSKQTSSCFKDPIWS